MPDRRPAANEAADFYQPYIAKIVGNDIGRAMEAQLEERIAPLRDVDEENTTVIHAPYGWTIKQVIGHLTDAERVFALRALRFGRDDATPLPGFDEHQYIASGEVEQRGWANLVDEFVIVRHGTIALFDGLPKAAWDRAGKANDSSITVRALAYVIAGHAKHHLDIVAQRLASA